MTGHLSKRKINYPYNLFSDFFLNFKLQCVQINGKQWAFNLSPTV